MRRIATIAMGNLVATAVVLAASVAALASNSAVQVQGGWSRDSSPTHMPNPDCGPWPSAGQGTAEERGIDTLGGSYVQLGAWCFAYAEEPNTVRVFDWEAVRIYVHTGEQATVKGDEWIHIQDPVACVSHPSKSINFTIDDFTGEHAGGRLIGQLNYVGVGPSASCPTDPPNIIVWYEGVFTPNTPRCGLGWELALLVPGLAWLHGRRRKQLH